MTIPAAMYQAALDMLNASNDQQLQLRAEVLMLRGELAARDARIAELESVKEAAE